MKTRAVVMITCLAAVIVACQKAAATRPQAQGTGVQANEEARLAAADAADGKMDTIVSRCATCRLGMDGDPRYSVAHAGYELHFCSAECKETFKRDPGAVIRGLPSPTS